MAQKGSIGCQRTNLGYIYEDLWGLVVDEGYGFNAFTHDS